MLTTYAGTCMSTHDFGEEEFGVCRDCPKKYLKDLTVLRVVTKGLDDLSGETIWERKFDFNIGDLKMLEDDPKSLAYITTPAGLRLMEGVSLSPVSQTHKILWYLEWDRETMAEVEENFESKAGFEKRPTRYFFSVVRLKARRGNKYLLLEELWSVANDDSGDAAPTASFPWEVDLGQLGMPEASRF